MIYPDFTGIRPARIRVDPLRDELRLGREEAGRAARESREGLSRSLSQLSEANQASLDRARTTLNAGVREPADSGDFGHLFRRKAATRGGAATQVSMIAKKWPP